MCIFGLSYNCSAELQMQLKECVMLKKLLNRYSIIAPFDTFEISYISKYYGKWSICSFGANALFSIIFSKVLKTLLEFLLNFFNIV